MMGSLVDYGRLSINSITRSMKEMGIKEDEKIMGDCTFLLIPLKTLCK
jgi:hypothetical protein